MADESTQTSAPESPPTSSVGSSGIDPKLAGLLSWIFAPITSLVFMLMDDLKKDEFVQLHAKQSLIFGIIHMLTPVLMFLMFIPVVGWILGCFGWLLSIAFFVARIVFAVKAYNGEKFKLPLVGDMVK